MSCNMTLSKLARLANVSVSVASKAFSGKGGVSDTMREHVFAVAREHGCFGQFYNAPYERPVVAVMVPEIDSRCYIKFIEEFKRSIDRNGYTMLLSVSNFDPQMEQTLIKYHLDHGKVDALIVVSGDVEFPMQSNAVMINIGRRGKGGGISFCAELEAGLDAAVEALVQGGHRRIAYVSEPHTRRKGEILQACLEKRGLSLPEQYFYTSEYRFEEAGTDGAAALLSLPEPPTAIFGAYGNVTRGILAEARRRGVDLPGALSVISMDGVPAPLDEQLDVAYVDNLIEELCALAMQEIELQLGVEKPKSPKTVLLSTTFHAGNSIEGVE